MIRLAVLGIDATEVEAFLAASAPREQGCFLLLREGRGAVGRRLIAVDPILPPQDAWEVKGPDQLRPSARWISAAVSKAVQGNAGLLFVHAHPDPAHPPTLSPTDVEAMRALAAAIGPILDGPFGAAVVHPRGWAASLWLDGSLVPVDRITAIGRTIRWLSPLPVAPDEDGDLDARQRDALGRAHNALRALTVAVVGVGGLGSPIAEQLVRMGVRGVTVVDSDVLDTPSNLRRVFGARSTDLRPASPLRKVDVVGRHLDEVGLETNVARIFGDVRTETAFRYLLDADVVVTATDTHSSRVVAAQSSTNSPLLTSSPSSTSGSARARSRTEISRALPPRSGSSRLPRRACGVGERSQRT